MLMSIRELDGLWCGLAAQCVQQAQKAEWWDMGPLYTQKELNP